MPLRFTKSRICLCAVLSFFTLLCACSEPTTAEVIASADEAIADGDAEEAVESCISLYDTWLSPSQRCHCALIYAKASQITGDPELMAMASMTLRRACWQNTDSVLAYIDKLPLEDKATLNEVYNLSSIGKKPSEDDILFLHDDFIESRFPR